MEQNYCEATHIVTIVSVDGDRTIREGDWLRLWKHEGFGIAHEAYLGVGGILYDNSGPGGSVRRANAREVVCQYKVIEIVARSTPSELADRIALAEEKLGIPWAGFYTCQNFASEICTGKASSFQRDAIVGLVVGLGLFGSLPI